jgi:hypothetical protein
MAQLAGASVLLGPVGVTVGAGITLALGATVYLQRYYNSYAVIERNIASPEFTKEALEKQITDALEGKNLNDEQATSLRKQLLNSRK